MKQLLLSFCVLFNAAGLTAASSAPAHLAAPAYFLAPAALDLPALLPPPPARDSLVQQAELEVLYQLQLARTPAQASQAHLIEAEDFFSFGAAVLGPWFTATNLPQTAAVLAHLGSDLDLFSRATKTYFNRRRPPFLDARLQPCVELRDTGSYPSGHAIRATAWAAVLSSLFPEHATAFEARAAANRWGRLLAGVHYPSDVEAGRILGAAISREMLKTPALQNKLKEIQAEIAPWLQRKAA